MIDFILTTITEDNVILDFSLIFFGAMVLGTIFVWLRQPIILAYIVLGILIGPLGFQVVTDLAVIEQLSQLGIIFLMFLLGINLFPQKLMALFKRTTLLVIVNSVLCFSLFLGISTLFGFSLSASIIISISLIFSSTIIGIKLMPTSTLHQKHEGELLVSVLLFQDIIAIFVLIFLYGRNDTTNSLSLSIVGLVVKLVILVVVAFLAIKFLIIPIQRKFSVIQDYIFLISLGWCLTLAQIAHWIGLSYEIGAFVAGFSLASSPLSRIISEGLKPLREFFLIIFFFSIGAEINVRLLSSIIIPALVMGIVLVGIKYLLFRYAFTLQKEHVTISKSIGWRLAQASEFSILVAYGAKNMGEISAQTATLIHTVTVITFIISTYCIVGFCTSPIASDTTHRLD